MDSIEIAARSCDGVGDVLDEQEQRDLAGALDQLRSSLDGRAVWHVSATATGGGVAELLSSLLGYQAGAGIDVHWSVVAGDDAFFAITKRLHNWLHDDAGDGGPLSERELARYREHLAPQGEELARMARPGDVAVLHDPQTAALVPILRRQGIAVAWRCHIGVDRPGELARRAWSCLLEDVEQADTIVFSRTAHIWDGLPPDQVMVVPPCIDVLSPKNRPLDPTAVTATLETAGLLAPAPSPNSSTSGNGRDRGAARQADITEEQPVPHDGRIVAQVSRWDRLKDPVGVLHAFEAHGPEDEQVHLVLAGPADGVADDPEGRTAFAEVREAWTDLHPSVRRRVHLARLPMQDADENARVVNALQRRADVVIQKSLAEGFGLTVAEAMWKRRPVIASAVGGIQDQIVHGESGILVHPRDHSAVGRALATLLADEDGAVRMGEAAHRRVRGRFLPQHHFAHEAELVGRAVGACHRPFTSAKRS